MCDPHLDHLDEYLALAEAAGAGIGHVFETHVQADHVSGALELARRAGAKIYVHESADVAFPHVDVGDGDEIQLGNDYVRVLHTPGHSEDSVCYLVGDRTRGPDPFPFPFLCFWTSCEAIFLSLFILISQDAQGRKDRLRTEMEYQVALKAQFEIMQLHRKMDELPAVVMAQLREIEDPVHPQ